MKNFVYLDCDNLDYISDKIDKFLSSRNLVTQHLNKIPHDELLNEVTELRDFINSFGLEVCQIIAIANSNLGYGGMHVDYVNNVRINFPVKNTKSDSTTVFYELENLEMTPDKTDEGYLYNKLKYSKLKVTDFYILDRPIAFNPKVPHELLMRKYMKDPRVILSIYFTTDPTHLLTT
jgi:hypothetical protein